MVAGTVALQPAAPGSALRARVGLRSALRPRASISADQGKPKEEALYEDDLPPKTPPKPPVSKAMRERLMKENRSLGGDPNASYGNPILVISGIIAVLAILVIGGGMA